MLAMPFSFYFSVSDEQMFLALDRRVAAFGTRSAVGAKAEVTSSVGWFSVYCERPIFSWSLGKRIVECRAAVFFAFCCELDGRFDGV